MSATLILESAAVLDGQDDYVEFSHSNDFLLANGTLTHWFAASGLDGKQTLLSKDSFGFDSGGRTTSGGDGNSEPITLGAWFRDKHTADPQDVACRTETRPSTDKSAGGVRMGTGLVMHEPNECSK